jgi:GAF domain-containing protein
MYIKFMNQTLPVKTYTTASTELSDLEETFKLKELMLASLISNLQVAFLYRADLTQILSKCAFAVANHIGINSVHIWSVNNAKQSIEFQASYGQGETTPTTLNFSPFIKQKKPFLVTSIENDPGVHDIHWLQSHGFTSWAGIPFIIDDKVLGILAMYSKAALPEDILETATPAALYICRSIELKSRKQKLEALQEQLIDSQMKLDSLQELTISRELKMIDLKDQIKQLSITSSQAAIKENTL